MEPHCNWQLTPQMYEASSSNNSFPPALSVPVQNMALHDRDPFESANSIESNADVNCSAMTHIYVKTEATSGAAEDSYFNFQLDSEYVAGIRNKIQRARDKSLKIHNKPSPRNSSPESLGEMYTDALNLSYGNRILFQSGRYFKLLELRTKTKLEKRYSGVIAICLNCQTHIKGSLRISSNFISHMKLKHPDKLKEFFELKANKIPLENTSTPKQEKRPIVSSSSQRSLEPKMPTQEFSISQENEMTAAAYFNFGETIEKQQQFERNMLNFLTSTITPPAFIEQPTFRKLFENTGLAVRDSTYYRELLDSNYATHVAIVKQQTCNVTHFCTTLDAWSVHARNFFAYTCHWIGADFRRHSAALACRSFTGSSEGIAWIIAKINAKYAIDEAKIMCTAIGNGAIYTESFEEFGIERDVGTCTEEVADPCENVWNECEQLSFHEIPFTQTRSYFKCANHTLHCISSSDFISILRQNNNLLMQHRQAFRLCNSIWRAYQNSNYADYMKNIGTALTIPSITQWNSIYNAVKTIVSQRTQLPTICEQLQCAPLTSEELAYLSEYLILMEPIVCALEFLQDANNMLFGYLIPSLVTIKVKLQKLQASQRLVYLQPACQEFIKCLLHRFKHFFEIQEAGHDALVAAVTCPSIKVRFLTGLRETAAHFTHDKLVALLVQYGMPFFDGSMKVEEQTGQQPVEDSSDFFDFGDYASSISAPNNASKAVSLQYEIGLYLNCNETSFETLSKFPTIQRLFFKYNTPLPSTAPVERMLQFDVMTESTKRQFSNADFERIMLMRYDQQLNV